MSNRPTGKEVVDLLSKFCNNMCVDEKEFVDALMNEHRTLQQGIFKIMAKCIIEWSKKEEGQYDLRNTATVEKCKKIVAAVPYLDSLPFI